jgi:hypothetical protein
MSPHDWTRGAAIITAGVRAHASGEVGAIARGNVELLEMSDRVEHVCAFPTELATVSLGEQSTGGGTAHDSSRLG